MERVSAKFHLFARKPKQTETPAEEAHKEDANEADGDAERKLTSSERSRRVEQQPHKVTMRLIEPNDKKSSSQETPHPTDNRPLTTKNQLN